MKTTKDFIEMLKAKHGLKSNYAVAKLLNQTDTAVARWAHGKNSFSDETAMQFADLLELDPAYVVACMHAERAKLDAEKKLWERIATMSIGVTAAVLFAIALPYAASYEMEIPDFIPEAQISALSEPLYIMSNEKNKRKGSQEYCEPFAFWWEVQVSNL
ncbi:MAG: hypothetical protein WCZ98_01485 [Sideroxydans sp.]